jgi:hypothetical protein
MVVIAILLSPILFILGLILFQKPYVTFMVNGKAIAVAKRSFFAPMLTESSVDVYAGTNKMFSLWEDSFDGPVLFTHLLTVKGFSAITTMRLPCWISL